ncbi:heterokaryon incompatibility protein-domain-containing protein [Xylaria longipes]|nr:heterokaryon incompatibility protein-domain-containing protein [Xylaria longipes]
MRLLNSHTRKIHNFISSEGIEEFAILSHTWGLEEVTLQDWQSLSAAELELKEGYRKIDYCCRQAIQDGYEWVWVDTCCIDKTSSAELSEAINSMFLWYQDAAICYAHLTDISDGVDQDSLLPALSESRWFTRGWTLQELLAPREIVFFSKNWRKLTTKLTSVEILSTITGIERVYLEGDALEDASAAKKMSWAAHRQTTRIEDIAYCLLGIFDINMPLIYGEGKKAFKRLQEEILKANPEDHTLFAWGRIAEKATDIPYIIISKEKAAKLDEIPWEASKINQPLSGLLAESPLDFKDSGGFITSTVATKFYKYAPRGVITSLPQFQYNSIRLQLPVHHGRYQSVCHWKQPQIATLRRITVAILLCCHEKAPNCLPGVLLLGCSKGYSFNRTREILLRYTPLSTSVQPPIFNNRGMLSIGPPRQLRIESDDVMLRRYIWGQGTGSVGWHCVSLCQTLPEGVIKMHGVKNGPICVLYNHLNQVSIRHGFGMRFERIKGDNDEMAGISAGLIPMDIGPSEETTEHDRVELDLDMKWYQRSECIRCDIPPENRKVLGVPLDTVIFDILPFPVITVRAERVCLGAGGNANDAFIYVLDIIITERMGPCYGGTGMHIRKLVDIMRRYRPNGSVSSAAQLNTGQG